MYILNVVTLNNVSYGITEERRKKKKKNTRTKRSDARENLGFLFFKLQLLLLLQLSGSLTDRQTDRHLYYTIVLLTAAAYSILHLAYSYYTSLPCLFLSSLLTVEEEYTHTQ